MIQPKQLFSDDLALELFHTLLPVGVPFADLVRFLMKYKCGKLVRHVGEDLGVDQTTVHKHLSGEKRSPNTEQDYLRKNLGFNPFEEAEALLGEPVFLDTTARRAKQRKLLMLDSSEKPYPSGIKDGQIFFDWVKHGIQSNELSINTENSLVHVLPEGVLLLSPMTFQKFIQAQPGCKSGAAASSQNLKRIQGRLEKLRLNIKTDRNLNIHKARIKNSNRMLHGFLFPTGLLFPGERPLVNQKLTLVR